MHSPDVLRAGMVIIPLQERPVMRYFQAVQQGRQRAARSQARMFEAAGFGMLTLTTKKVGGEFQPVGEEDMAAVVASPDGYVAILADGDGFTKAQSRAVSREEALGIFRKLRDSGVPEYPGGEIQIWSETRPAVQGGAA